VGGEGVGRNGKAGRGKRDGNGEVGLGGGRERKRERRLDLDICPGAPRVASYATDRTLLHVLLSKLLNSVTPLPSSGLYTG